MLRLGSSALGCGIQQIDDLALVSFSRKCGLKAMQEALTMFSTKRETELLRREFVAL